MKKCPYCAEEIQDEAILCRYCKRSLIGNTEPVKEKSPFYKLFLPWGSVVLVAILVVGLGSVFVFGGFQTSILASFATPTVTPSPTPIPTCLELSQPFLKQSEDLLARWDDEKAVAEITPRIALSPLVANLQKLKKEAEELVIPSCSENIKAILVNYMNTAVDSYLLFLADRPAVDVIDKRNSADALRVTYQNLVRALK